MSGKDNKIDNLVNISVQKSLKSAISVSKKQPQAYPSIEHQQEQINQITENKPQQSSKRTNNKKENSNLNNILNLLDDNNETDYLNEHTKNLPTNSGRNEEIPSSAEILHMVLELREYKKTTAEMKSIIEDLRKELKEKEEAHS